MRTNTIIHIKFGACGVRRTKNTRRKQLDTRSVYVQCCDNGVLCNIRRLRPHIGFIFQIPELDTQKKTTKI